MRAHKKMTIISVILAIVTFLGAVIMHYCCSCYETEFWINVCLGLFGGAALGVLTSVVFYNYEKEKTLKNFLYYTQQILSIVNKYQEHMTLEEKIRFFLEYSEFDKMAWNSEFGNIDFFFERITKNRKYIYYNIYKPIVDFNNAVARHIWHFRWHLDGSGKNDVVMQEFVSELQGYLLKKEKKELPLEYNGQENDTFVCYSTVPKLVFEVKEELGGRYYVILCGKRQATKERKLEEEQTNGKNENGDA